MARSIRRSCATAAWKLPRARCAMRACTPFAPRRARSTLPRHIVRLDPEARGVDVVRLAARLDSGKRVSVTKTLELEGLTLGRVREPVPHFEVELTPQRPARIPGAIISIGQRPTANSQRIQ